MKNTPLRSISFLGVALMATQLIGAANANVGVQGSSIAFEQAIPATPVQKEVDKLLRQISSNALAAGRHAEELESYARAGQRFHQQTHAAQLTRMKHVINRMGSDFRQLQELRPSALPWQQLVIDQLEPALIGLAGQTNEAIERLNQDRPRLMSQGYRDAVGNLNIYASRARNLVSVHLNYAEAREKLNRLDTSAAEPVAGMSPAQEATGLSSKALKSLEQQVRSRLLMLPYYGVFDYLAFQVDGNEVTLSGHVSWPTLKTEAEGALRGIEGLESVSNNIEVLPVSSNDDRIRLAAYRAIYGHSTLARYRLHPHPPIRIIVKNGNLTLLGVVDSDMDRTIANMLANGVSGAFSVTNNLQIGS